MDKTLTNFISWKRAISIAIDEKMEHSAAPVCYLCGEKIKREKKVFREVKDHCCCIEKYQGTTHLMCNLQYEEYGCILVLAHNSSGCD